MAEGVFRHRADQADLDCVIDSAGTAAYHVGKAPDSRAIQVAKSRGIDIAGLRARQLSSHDVDRFDQIYVMDEANLLATHRLSDGSAMQGKKIMKITSLIHHKSDLSGIDVPDPYYGTTQDFEAVFGLLELAADAWLGSLNGMSRNG